MSDDEGSSPPASPTRILAELTQNAVFTTPRRNGRLMRKFQKATDDVAETVASLKRQLQEAQLNSKAPKRTRRSRGSRIPETVVDGEQLKRKIQEAGRKFVVVGCTFPTTDWILDTPLDSSFDSRKEFENEDSIAQGQVRQARAFLPVQVQKDDLEEYVPGTFVDGIDGGRGTISTRLRKQSTHHIVPRDLLPYMKTPTSRRQELAVFIGYTGMGEDGIDKYDVMNADILFSDAADKSVDGLFRGDVPLKVAASLLRGINGAEDMGSAHKAPTFEKKYRIKSATPSFIANVSMLSIWLYSADVYLTMTGGETSLHYGDIQTLFLSTMLAAMDENKAWPFALIDHWNTTLWPNASVTTVDASAGATISVSVSMQAMLANAPTREAPPRQSPSPIQTPPRSSCNGHEQRTASGESQWSWSAYAALASSAESSANVQLFAQQHREAQRCQCQPVRSQLLARG